MTNERAKHRVEAFNDLAAVFDRDGMEEAAKIARNMACLEMVSAGVTTFDEIRERKSSEWPAKPNV